jgi:hypothetical protein
LGRPVVLKDLQRKPCQRKDAVGATKGSAKPRVADATQLYVITVPIIQDQRPKWGKTLSVNYEPVSGAPLQ